MRRAGQAIPELVRRAIRAPYELQYFTISNLVCSVRARL
jgi:hypothetical protein